MRRFQARHCLQLSRTLRPFRDRYGPRDESWAFSPHFRVLAIAREPARLTAVGAARGSVNETPGGCRSASSRRARFVTARAGTRASLPSLVSMRRHCEASSQSSPATSATRSGGEPTMSSALAIGRRAKRASSRTVRTMSAGTAEALRKHARGGRAFAYRLDERRVIRCTDARARTRQASPMDLIVHCAARRVSALAQGCDIVHLERLLTPEFAA